MTQELPTPLVRPEVNLKGFSGFMLDVDRLLASELVALGNPAACWAALMLWARAWKQTPPASLPDDEAILAAFSGAGRGWKKVRSIALRGFVKCSDGRLYHRVLSEEANKAWERRRKFQERSAKGNDARRNQQGAFKDYASTPSRNRQGVLNGGHKASLEPPVEETGKGQGERTTTSENPNEGANPRNLKQKGPYAFEFGVIRLNAKDLEKWRKAFFCLSLEAKLIALAPWAEQQPNWFNAVAGALAKAQQEAKAKADQSTTTAPNCGRNHPQYNPAIDWWPGKRGPDDLWDPGL